MFQTTIYGFIARDDDHMIPKVLKDKVTKGILVGVEVYNKNENLMHWVKCLFWNNHLSNLYPYLKKGKHIIVMGDLSFSAYLSRDQQPKVDLNLKVNALYFCKTLNGDIIHKSTPISASNEKKVLHKEKDPSSMNSIFDSIYGKPTQPDQPDLFSHGNDIPDLEIPF